MVAKCILRFTLRVTHLKQFSLGRDAKFPWPFVLRSVPFPLCKRRWEFLEILFGPDNACVSSLPVSPQDCVTTLPTLNHPEYVNFAQDCEHWSCKHLCYIEQLSTLFLRPEKQIIS